MWSALVLTLCLQDGDFRRLALDKDPDVRARAVEMIRGGRDPKAAPALLPLLGDDHPRVRARAVQALAAATGLEDIAKTGLASPRPLVRQGTCEALGRARAAVLAPALLDRLGDPDPGVRARAAEALGALGDASAADRLALAFQRNRDGATRASVLEALARLAPEKARPLLPEAAEDPSYPVRMVAAESLPRAGGTGTLLMLPKLIDDRDWRVRVSAIEACLDVRARETVGWLAARLVQEKGRLRWDILCALHDLTGNDLGPDAGPWKAWYEANRDTLPIRPRPRKGETPAPSMGTTSASFFNVPILSDRLLFILDLSGSMRDPSPGSPDPKLEVARRGMIDTVRALDPRARFGILGLGSDEDGRYSMREQKTWGGRLALLPASPAAKADAERFMRRLEARGWTNIYDALEYAFGDPDADTIFLYSDGGASRGIFSANGEILEHVARMNRFRKIVIHTVEVPGEKNPADNRRLLARLAEESGGTCRLHGKK
jgi:HEAT repeat protein